MTKSILLGAIALILGFRSISQPKSDSVLQEYNNYFKPVKWRSIGPFRGGRSNSATGVVGDPSTYYMGTTGGGLWKTTDMGITWNNISDGFFKLGSVGDVVVSESDPNLVFVGMGEHAPRGVMTTHGDGVYKSTDAGKTWKQMGLAATQHISRIVIDPRDNNTVFVGAQGALFDKNKERGVYKSTDGGVTWKNVLYVNDQVGCSELSIDYNNPRVIYAAMWEHGRKPWQILSGGAGSGIWKSVDGGEHWNKLTTGLPKLMGKIGISVSRANSNKVYAIIEADRDKEEDGLYSSDDGGENWSHASKDNNLTQRAWYYIKCFADPRDENTVYVMAPGAFRSKDGGQTWDDISGVHGDFHNLWINPNNNKNLVIVNDGGCNISVNAGATFTDQANMPTGQFYRISVDNRTPYHIYGGQQDNSSVEIPSRVINGYGIGRSDWHSSAGGESAFLAFDPDAPRYVMGGSYSGTIEILDNESRGSTQVMAAPIQYLGSDPKDIRYRFNWNAPIIWSKHYPGSWYHGGQKLLRTTDMGKTWAEVSPDLTRNEKEKQGRVGIPITNEEVGAENYGTLTYVIESPFEKGLILTGSDDGLVYMTRDNCATWKNITPAGLPETQINAIEVSPFDKGTFYIATNRQKFEDKTPALYKTTDYGKTWTRINNGIPDGSYTTVVREDDQRKDLLYAGTVNGLYISWNGGKDWFPFQLNLPVCPITDLKVYRGNLIASTQGRAFWILDDLSVIRAYKKDSLNTMTIAATDNVISKGGGQMDGPNPSGVDASNGVNPANGIVLYYNLPDTKDSIPLVLEVKDASGKLIHSYSTVADTTDHDYHGAPGKDPLLSKNKGLNRFVWNMRYPTITGVPKADMELGFSGHKAIPGKYTFTLKQGSKTASTSASILPHPLYSTTPSQYQEWDKIMGEMEATADDMNQRINKQFQQMMQLDQVVAHLPAEAKYDALRKDGNALLTEMRQWDEDMVQRRSQAYDDVENFPNKFNSMYMFMKDQTDSDIPRVNQPSIDRKAELDAQWVALKARNEAIQARIPAYNKALYDAGIGGVWKK